eukprot:10382580-Ditylum_brightwellii.AAC.1
MNTQSKEHSIINKISRNSIANTTEHGIINNNNVTNVNCTEHGIINNNVMHTASMHNMPMPNITAAAFPYIANALAFPNVAIAVAFPNV